MTSSNFVHTPKSEPIIVPINPLSSTIPDPFSITKTINIGPTPGLTLDNPVIGSSPQNPPNPENPQNPTNDFSISTMEILVKTLLEHMVIPPTPKPIILKTNYDKPPTYNVQKLNENTIGFQI